MSGKIFINYRRGDDPGHTGRLFDRLQDAFEPDQLFLDVDSIAPGLDFVRVLEEQVSKCDVLLVVIGKGWIDARDSAGDRRLDHPEDFVRIEVEAGLRLGKRVIPVLVNDAEMPGAEQLPETLKPLARRNAVRLTHDQFKGDTQGLIKALGAALDEAETARRAQATAEAEAAVRARAEAAARAKEAERRREEEQRRAVLAGLSPEQIAKAEEVANWELIKESQSAQDFRGHLARFPGGVFERVVRTKLEALIWAGLGPDPSGDALRAFLEEFPAGAHAAAAGKRLEAHLQAEAAGEADKRERQEKGAWVVASDADTIEAYELFLLAWPEGSHVPAAKEQLRKLRLRDGDEAERAFAAVRHADSASAVAEFLASYPESALAAEARALHTALVAREEADRRAMAGDDPAVSKAFPATYSKGNLADQVRTRLQSLATGLAWRPSRRVLLVGGALVIGAVGIWLVTAPSSVQRSPTDGVPLSPERERALKPKDSFKECDACPEMIVVPAGSFAMGSPEHEVGRRNDEDPRHTVTFARPFAVGRFSVTFEQWDACISDSGCNGYRPADEGWGRGRRPAINVSWDDAKTYVAWLSRKTGKAYRLLSEAEREYVTRAGTTTPFWWGGSISTSQANYDGRYAYGGGAVGEYRGKTLPVDSFQPNPWGLYQVHGNVWEWVEDCQHDDYRGAPSDGSAWMSGDCSRRVVRGGSWANDARDLRAAGRLAGTVGGRDVILGFRVGRSLTP